MEYYGRGTVPGRYSNNTPYHVELQQSMRPPVIGTWSLPAKLFGGVTENYPHASAGGRLEFLEPSSSTDT